MPKREKGRDVRRGRGGGFHREGTRGQVPEVWRAGLRERDELRLREVRERGTHLRFQDRRDHPAAGD